MIQLEHAVGHGARNTRSDVRLVQHLLNRHGTLRAALLKIDGIVGPKTMAAIRGFQANVVHLHPVDGRVDPGGPSFTALTTPPHALANLRVTPKNARGPSPASVKSSPPTWAAVTKPTLPVITATPATPKQHDVIAWGAKVSPSFKRKVLEMTTRLQISPDFLMACMAFESGETFSPAVRNAAGSGATGLIQFMPSTAKALHTTTEALAAMNAEQQLVYVERYFRPYKGRIRTIEDIYMTILYPKAIGQTTDYVLFSGSTKAYRQNKGLDADGDKAVNKYEAAAAVRAKYHKGLRAGYIG